MTPAQLDDWIKRHQLKRREAAKALGHKESIIYRYLNGSRPIPDYVRLLCKALDKLKNARQ